MDHSIKAWIRRLRERGYGDETAITASANNNDDDDEKLPPEEKRRRVANDERAEFLVIMEHMPLEIASEIFKELPIRILLILTSAEGRLGELAVGYVIEVRGWARDDEWYRRLSWIDTFWSLTHQLIDLHENTVKPASTQLSSITFEHFGTPFVDEIHFRITDLYIPSIEQTLAFLHILGQDQLTIKHIPELPAHTKLFIRLGTNAIIGMAYTDGRQIENRKALAKEWISIIKAVFGRMYEQLRRIDVREIFPELRSSDEFVARIFWRWWRAYRLLALQLTNVWPNNDVDLLRVGGTNVIFGEKSLMALLAPTLSILTLPSAMEAAPLTGTFLAKVPGDETRLPWAQLKTPFAESKIEEHFLRAARARLLRPFWSNAIELHLETEINEWLSKSSMPKARAIALFKAFMILAVDDPIAVTIQYSMREIAAVLRILFEVKRASAQHYITKYAGRWYDVGVWSYNWFLIGEYKSAALSHRDDSLLEFWNRDESDEDTATTKMRFFVPHEKVTMATAFATSSILDFFGGSPFDVPKLLKRISLSTRTYLMKWRYDSPLLIYNADDIVSHALQQLNMIDRQFYQRYIFFAVKTVGDIGHFFSEILDQHENDAWDVQERLKFFGWSRKQHAYILYQHGGSREFMEMSDPMHKNLAFLLLHFWIRPTMREERMRDVYLHESMTLKFDREAGVMRQVEIFL